MPEHEMPFKGNEDCDLFGKLDEFTQGYVHAIFFTECHGDNPELQHMTFADFAPESLVEIILDCQEFQRHYGTYLVQAAEFAATKNFVYNDERAGSDYWYSRNGHGVGYWDRGLGAIGEKLYQNAKQSGTRDVYAGDDKKLYISK